MVLTRGSDLPRSIFLIAISETPDACARSTCVRALIGWTRALIGWTVERLLAVELGVDWGAYDREVSSK